MDSTQTQKPPVQHQDLLLGAVIATAAVALFFYFKAEKRAKA
jgi:hypothetical protein